MDDYWPVVEPILKRAIEYADGKYTIHSVYNAIVNRDMQLWLALGNGIEGVWVTQIVQYPSKKVFLFMFCAGEHMDYWLNAIPQFEEWAKERGCEAMEIYGRPGWRKVLPEWERTHVVLRKNL